MPLTPGTRLGCLEKDPRERVRDIGDVRLAMEGAFETTVIAQSEPSVPITAKIGEARTGNPIKGDKHEKDSFRPRHRP